MYCLNSLVYLITVYFLDEITSSYKVRKYMRKEGKEVFLSGSRGGQRGLNGHGKARQKTLAPIGVFLAPPRVSSVSAPGKDQCNV